jgi:hypothetical protein
MRGEPEPGSVIESRTAVQQRVHLGQVERKCLQCGKDWVDPRCSCGSFEFSERAIYVRAYFNTRIGTAHVAARITKQKGEFRAPRRRA